jgi:hypothetical protein
MVRDIRYQFKILTTALFTCSLLGRRFTRQQILALCVLTLGVGLVQVDTANGGSGEIVPAPGNIYATPLRFKLSGHPVLSARFNVETAGSERKRPEI